MKKQQQEKTDLKQQLFMCFILSENASSQTYFKHTPPPPKPHRHYNTAKLKARRGSTCAPARSS